MSSRVHVCVVGVCVYISRCVHGYVYTHLHRPCTHIFMRAIHTHYTYTHRDIRTTHMNINIHISHAGSYECVHACVCMCKHTHTHTHIHTCCTDTLHMHPVWQNIPKFATATTQCKIRSMKHYVIHNIIILFLIIVSSRSRICELFFSFSIFHFVQVCFTPAPRHHARIQCVI